MLNYSKPLPHGNDNEAKQGSPPPFLAQTRYASENSSASSVITLGHNTTEVEIAAVGAPAVMRWVTTSDTQASVVSAAATANYDHVVPTATFRRFVVPRENIANFASVQGINRAEGLYQRVAIKSIGVASVLLSEY